MMPLHCACWKGQTEAAEFLLSNGAQISESDTSLKTALHWTVQFGHFETLLTLLKVRLIPATSCVCLKIGSKSRARNRNFTDRRLQISGGRHYACWEVYFTY